MSGLGVRLAVVAGAAYFLSARGSYALAIGAGTVTLWAPSGITLALLLLNPFRAWGAIAIGVLAGSIASDLVSGYAPGLAVFAALANLVEALVAARLLLVVLGPRPMWSTVRGALTFTLCAPIASNALTALAGATMLKQGFHEPYVRAWFTWWAGDGLGMLIVTPAVLTWTDAVRARATPSRRMTIEAIALAVSLAAAACLSLGPSEGITAIHPGAYIVFPFLFWAALRFGPVGAATGSAGLAVLTTWFAFSGYGPLALAGQSEWAASLHVYMFLAVASASSLIFAAAIAERRASARELLRSEERFRRAQKLEAVGKLAGGIAHDFNNLLTVIQGNCDLLSDAVPAGTQQHEDLMQIRTASQRAAALTQQLLAFSRRQVLAPRLLRVQDVLTAIDPMLRRLLGGQIAVETSGPNASPILADLSQLEQIIVNLSINARDAMPDGGTLRFDVSDVRVGEEQALGLGVTPGEYVRVDVSDTGTGIDSAIREHLFEPFVTTKPEGSGTGLGLATVHGIVTQSQGGIDVESEPGRGTKFSLYFPRARGSAAAG